MRGEARMIPGNGVYGLTVELSLFGASSQLVTGQEPKKTQVTSTEVCFCWKMHPFCHVLFSMPAPIYLKKLLFQWNLWKGRNCSERYFVNDSKEGRFYCWHQRMAAPFVRPTPTAPTAPTSNIRTEVPINVLMCRTEKRHGILLDPLPRPRVEYAKLSVCRCNRGSCNELKH